MATTHFLTRQWRFVLALALWWGGICIGSASTSVTEVHQLDVGWNSVWFETTPIDSEGNLIDADDFFGDYPSIKFVASPAPTAATAEFLAEIGENSFNSDEWLTWRSSDSTGGDSLGAVLGGRAYLIYTEGNSPEISFAGEAFYNPPVWKAGSYNLRGFRTDGLTFAALFDGVTDIFPLGEIYQLGADGNWTSLTGAASAVVESGVAYWIKCNKATSYMGPVSLDVGESGEIAFGSGIGTTDVTIPADGDDVLSCTKEGLQIENVSTSSQTATFTRVDSESLFELYHLALSNTELKWEGVAVTAAASADFTLNTEETEQFTMAVYRAWSTAPSVREALVDCDLGGVKYYLPLSAGSKSVTVSADGDTQSDSYAGLWVGEVTFGAVTSLTEDSLPISDTTSQFVMPIIFHVASDSSVNLLSAVVLMQTKETESDTTPEPVLVINNERLPFFEGIQERNGKQVGIRFESAGYDMPRIMDTSTQSDLQQEVYDQAADDTYDDVSDVTETDMAVFVAGQDVRPSTLVESYYKKWPMSGTLGSGGSLQTESALTLDPFHRSNPFRHAYHSKHLAGFQISRVISVSFSTSDTGDLLSGYYREDVSGLTQPNLSVASGTQSVNKIISSTGTITLRRVTNVGTLEE